MKLKDNIHMKYPDIPGMLSGEIQYAGTRKLNPNLMQLFAESLYCVGKQMELEHLVNVPIRLNVIFSKDYNFGFEEDENDISSNGCYFNLIVYPLDKIEKLNNNRMGVFVFTEELTHCIWQIKDETKVKHKVIEILKNLSYYNDITIEEVEKWGINWK